MSPRTWSLAVSILALCTISVSGSGCMYAKNRYKDFCDPLSFGFGIGAGVSARATHYVQGGLLVTGPRCSVRGLSLFPPFWFIRNSGRGFARRVDAPIGPAGEAGVAPIFHYRGLNNGDEHPSKAIVLFRTLNDASKDRSWALWHDSNLWSFYPGILEYRQNYDRDLFDIGGSLYLGLGVDVDDHAGRTHVHVSPPEGRRVPGRLRRHCR